MQGPLPPPRRILLLSFLCESGHKGWLCCTELSKDMRSVKHFYGSAHTAQGPVTMSVHLHTLRIPLCPNPLFFFNSNLKRGSRINCFCHFWEQDWLVKPQPGQNRFHSRNWSFMVLSCLPRISKRDTREDKIWTFFCFPSHKLGCKHCTK